MDLSNVHTATKQYNWRGEHVAYQVNGTTIPCAEGNSDFAALRERIARDECRELEPVITTARKVLTANGSLTGYDTNLGFVPNRPDNRLYQLLQGSLSARQVIADDPEPIAAAPNIAALIFCTMLDRRWQHLAGTLERTFPYKSHEHSHELSLHVRIRNIPEPADDALPHLLEAFGQQAGLLARTRYRPLQLGTVEVEIPTNRLQKLFRGERQRIPKAIRDFVEDSLDLHHERTARARFAGPDISWLLDMAPYYLTHVVSNTANVAIQAFNLEYGGTSPGHVNENDLLRSSLCFARLDGGDMRLHRFQHQGEQSYGLKGEWPTGPTLLRLADPEMRKRVDAGYVSSRVRQLFASGFALEALLVANAMFEVVLHAALMGAVASSAKAAVLVDRKGHSYRLELLGKIVASKIEPGLDTKEFAEFCETMNEANSMRNAFVHQLVLPVDDPWSIALLDRAVERVLRFVADPHLSFITVGFVAGLARDRTPATHALIVSELQKLKEWNEIADD